MLAKTRVVEKILRSLTYNFEMKRHSTLKIFKVEVVVMEIVEIVTVIKDTRAKQIGGEEDAVEEEAVDQFIPTFSATNVTNMVTMRMIVTSTHVKIVAEWGILRKIVEPIKRWKKQST